MPRKYQKFEGFPEPISDIDWARMAAYIDGEGHISIECQKRYRGSPNSQEHYALQIGIANTSSDLMDWIFDRFGGTVYAKPPKYGYKQQFCWNTSAKRAVAVLHGCLPYFVVKANQARVAILFQDRKSKGRRGVWMSSDELAFREACRTRLIAMHRA